MSTPKVGQIFLECFVDDDTGKIEWIEHHLRTIRKGYAFATGKHSWTWGKRSTRHGDFGWLDPVAAEWRTKWRVDGERPAKLAQTKLAAARYALELHQKYGEPDDHPAGLYERITQSLERLISRERNARKKKAA